MQIRNMEEVAHSTFSKRLERDPEYARRFAEKYRPEARDIRPVKGSLTPQRKKASDELKKWIADKRLHGLAS